MHISVGVAESWLVIFTQVHLDVFKEDLVFGPFDIIVKTLGSNPPNDTILPIPSVLADLLTGKGQS